jgi:hypothetical protein
LTQTAIDEMMESLLAGVEARKAAAESAPPTVETEVPA